jgi:hypothetical protein
MCISCFHPFESCGCHCKKVKQIRIAYLQATAPSSENSASYTMCPSCGHMVPTTASLKLKELLLLVSHMWLR